MLRFLLITAIFSAGTMGAATVTPTSATGATGNWRQNWSAATTSDGTYLLPASIDTAVISQGRTIIVDSAVSIAAGPVAVNNTNEAALPSAFLDIAPGGQLTTGNIIIAQNADAGTLTIRGGALTVNGTINVKEAGTFTLSSGSFTRGGTGTRTIFTDTNGAGGQVRITGGTFTATATGGSLESLSLLADSIRISGGTVAVTGGQTVLADTTKLTVVGTSPNVTLDRLNLNSTTRAAIIRFELGPTGVSAITSGGYVDLSSARLEIDGSLYTGGPKTIDLFVTPDLVAVSTSVTVTGLGTQGVDYTVTQSVGSNFVRLQIIGMRSARNGVEALGGLTTAPAIFQDDKLPGTAASVAAGETRKVYYDGLVYQGNPKRVCAFIGIPAGASPSNRVPAVVLAHGGGGRPYAEWVEKWTQRGYAAIAMGLEGQTEVEATQQQIDAGQSVGQWLKHAMPGPARIGIYGDTDAALGNQWMYHAVADVILANSLMRSLPMVNPSNVGIMGISWGGVVASTAMGIDNRFVFSIPTYGAGHKYDIPNQYGAALASNTFYRGVWDPILRINRATMPALWLSWPGEDNFSLDSQAYTYRAAGGPRMVSLVPGMQHGHPAAWNRPEGYDFADEVIASATPWCVMTSAARTGTAVQVVFQSSKPLLAATLLNTPDSGHTGLRTWNEVPVTSLVQGPPGTWTANAVLPMDTTAWFINASAAASDPDANSDGVSDNYGYVGGRLVVSSEFQETSGLIVSPSATLEIRFPSNASQSSSALNVGYLGMAQAEITSITIADASHPGSFSQSWSAPRTLTTPLPMRLPLTVTFNNGLAGLSPAQQASATLVIAWRNPADTTTGTANIPLLATVVAPVVETVYDFASIFPPSESWSAGGQLATISDVYAPADASTWAITFPETDVFAFSIKGTSQALGAWTMRIGKGGQIFSIRANGKEWIAPQYRSASAPNRAPWIDEVSQFVALNRTLDTETSPYFIHGAGIYLDDPAYAGRPFYSPMLASRIDATFSRLNTANWAQHAHVPTAFRSGLVHFQRITDRGQGIVEIEHVIHNSGNEALDWFNMPWMGVRISSLPKLYLYSAGGRTDRSDKIFGIPDVTPLTSTDGYAAFTESSADDSPCLALVFGNTAPSGPLGFVDGTPDWRDGAAVQTIPNPLPADDLSWRNLRVGTARQPVKLDPGESLLARYFYVIGREADARARIASHGLVARSGITKLTFTTPPSWNRKPWYASSGAPPLTPVETPAAGQSPWFTTSSKPAAGWRPLLVLDNIDAAPATAANRPVTANAPVSNIVASQTNRGANATLRWTSSLRQSPGQTFTLTQPKKIDKLFLESANFQPIGSGDHRIRLWIGGWNGTNPVLPGTTFEFDSSNLSWSGVWYAFDIPDIELPAGTHAFQLSWASEASSHDLVFSRANANGDYAGGGGMVRSFASDPALPFTATPSAAGDLVFHLTGTAPLAAVLTDDLYQLAHPTGPPADGFWRPYNGNTLHWRLLGFVPDSAAGMAGQIPVSLGSRLSPGNTLPGNFTRTLYTGITTPDAVECQILANGTSLYHRHRIPVGWSYQIERSTDLIDWLPLTSTSIGTNSLLDLTLPPPVTGPFRSFYRVRYASPASP
jgi:dienelactone hydrolase